VSVWAALWVSVWAALPAASGPALPPERAERVLPWAQVPARAVRRALPVAAARPGAAMPWAEMLPRAARQAFSLRALRATALPWALPSALAPAP
jgi:hypothetical protein